MVSRMLPLFGLTIVVTRAAHQAEALAGALADRGANAVVAPTIEIVDPESFAPLDAAIERAAEYDWAIFTSATGADRFLARMRETGHDAGELARARIAAVGPATARALERRGLRVDLVPESYVAESLVSALDAIAPVAGKRFLLARAAVARDVVPDALDAAGALVDVVEAYRTVEASSSREMLAALVDRGEVDLVTFTSASTVTNFVQLVGASRATGTRAACIGPITAATARDAGFDVTVEAEEYTVPGLVAAIERWALRAIPRQ